jgi:hypothetical protein
MRRSAYDTGSTFARQDVCREKGLYAGVTMAIRKFVSCLLILAAATGFGCSSSSPAAAHPPANDGGGTDRVLTGQMAGTDATVAIVASPRHARVYFCGGSSSYGTLTHWFTVDIDSTGKAISQPDAGDWALQAQLEGDRMIGSVTPADGVVRAFQAGAVAAGTIAGLYETLASPCGRIGLIVLQSSGGAAPTGQGACIGSGAAGGLPSVLQVNPIVPIARSADGSIPVVVAGSTAEVMVLPAAPPAN